MHVENVIYPYHLRRQAQYQPAYTVVSALQSPPRRNTRFITLKHTYPGLPNLSTLGFLSFSFKKTRRFDL